MYSIKYSDFFVMLQNIKYYLFGVGTSGKLKVLLKEKNVFLLSLQKMTTTESIILCIFSVCSPEDILYKKKTILL